MHYHSSKAWSTSFNNINDVYNNSLLLPASRNVALIFNFIIDNTSRHMVGCQRRLRVLAQLCPATTVSQPIGKTISLVSHGYRTPTYFLQLQPIRMYGHFTQYIISLQQAESQPK